MEQVCVTKARPRDRIVDTACDLFRKHGLRGIGVDAIAEAAGNLDPVERRMAAAAVTRALRQVLAP